MVFLPGRRWAKPGPSSYKSWSEAFQKGGILFSFLERISDGKEENKTITFSLLFQLKHRNSIFLKGRGGFVVLAESFFIYYCFPLTFFFFFKPKKRASSWCKKHKGKFLSAGFGSGCRRHHEGCRKGPRPHAERGGRRGPWWHQHPRGTSSLGDRRQQHRCETAFTAKLFGLELKLHEISFFNHDDKTLSESRPGRSQRRLRDEGGCSRLGKGRKRRQHSSRAAVKSGRGRLGAAFQLLFSFPFGGAERGMPLAADPARSRGALSAARGWRRAASPGANRPGTAIIKKKIKKSIANI